MHCTEEIAVDARQNLAIILLIFLAAASNVGIAEADPLETASQLNVGPYVDEVTYEIIMDPDQRILALQAGDIEMDTGFVDPQHLSTLDWAMDLDIFSALRNGYGHITINCGKYPMNISGFRRAFAYAFDKTRVTVEITDGFSQEHDSLVPYVSDWCIENELPYHYYFAQESIGNTILDELEFEIDSGTGWRTAPDGSPFSIEILYASSSPEVAGGIAQIAADTLAELHVNAEAQAHDFNQYGHDWTQDYDMVFYATDFEDYDVQWLATEYWSENSGDPYSNLCHFSNATFDSWRDQLLTAPTYEGVFEAAEAMQLILHENVPRLVVYQNVYMQGYRNDVFQGHVEDLVQYITGFWTMRKISRISGVPGGTVPVAISREPDSFNLFVSTSKESSLIFDNIYSSLYRKSPNQEPVMDLAMEVTQSTHASDSSVPEGHVRYTVDIVRNATWSDGTPLTAEDVAFTFSYLIESLPYGNTASLYLDDLNSAMALSPYQVRIEFSSESYWNFRNFAYTRILPKHVFTGLAYDEWNLWNPLYDPEEPFVTCGPYTLSDYEAGEYYTMMSNPLYHYYPRADQGASPGVYQTTIEYTFNTAGHYIQWSSDPAHALTGSYAVYYRNSIYDEGTWSGGYLAVDVSGLPIGQHEFTMNVTYLDGYLESWEILVMVHASQEEAERNFQLLMLAASISIISITVIAGVVLLSARDYRFWKKQLAALVDENERDWFTEVFGQTPR